MFHVSLIGYVTKTFLRSGIIQETVDSILNHPHILTCPAYPFSIPYPGSEAAKAKADEYLEALARAPPLVPRKNASGGVLNMLGGAIGGSKTPDLQGFPGFGSSMPGLMDMVGAGSGGGGGIADLMSSIMNGSEGLGGAVGSGAESSGIDKKQMLKTAKKMTKVKV